MTNEEKELYIHTVGEQMLDMYTDQPGVTFRDIIEYVTGELRVALESPVSSADIPDQYEVVLSVSRDEYETALKIINSSGDKDPDHDT